MMSDVVLCFSRRRIFFQCISSYLRLRNQKSFARCLKISTKPYCTKKLKLDDPMDSDEPIKYSKSPAASWKAAYTFSGRPLKEEPPWFEFWIIQGSVMIFLIYFGVLREESDIDEKLKRSPEELFINQTQKDNKSN